MARKDYEEIKETFQKFVQAWKTRDSDLLGECFVKEAACNLSTVAKYPCGGQHGIYGIKDFVMEVPSPDFFYSQICNFVARINKDKAYQTATVVCLTGVHEEDQVRTMEFSALFANGWVRCEEGWRISEMRMDITEYAGDYQEFIDKWYFEKPELKYYFGIHLPCISGETDNAWFRIPEEENVKSDEEKILETFSRYAYGIDTLNFDLLPEALSDELIVNMAPWGAMDKREFMATLKFKRMAVRYWNHPARLEDVSVDGDKAFLRLHRMAGHKQSDHPVILTKENVDTIHACARYEIIMKKENDCWRIVRMDYFLGTIDLEKQS